MFFEQLKQEEDLLNASVCMSTKLQDTTVEPGQSTYVYPKLGW